MRFKQGLLALLGAAAVAFGASADPSVTINSVRQNYPWNNTVEINYTIGGTKASSDTLYALSYSYATSTGGTKTAIPASDMSGTAMVDSDDFQISGTYTAIWTAPAGISTDTAELTIEVQDVTEQGTPATEANATYMVVRLDNGKVYYRTWASQDAANTAYNTDEYKTTKMVFRKVPVGTYQTGFSGESTGNDPKSWNLSSFGSGKSYWIGVFQVTQAQYELIGATAGSTPSNFKSVSTGGTFPDAYATTGLRPVEQVSWQDIRDSSAASAAVTLGGVTADSSGTFLQRLNAKTESGAGVTGFDLPTEVMFEIAERAGATTKYWWGSSQDAASNGQWHTINSSNSGSRTVEVGRTIPNAWGLYDMAGNVWEWCLDQSDYSNDKQMANRTSPYVPYSGGSSSNRRSRGGGNWNFAPSNDYFAASYRGHATPSSRSNYIGFRVARVCP